MCHAQLFAILDHNLSSLKVLKQSLRRVQTIDLPCVPYSSYCRVSSQGSYLPKLVAQCKDILRCLPAEIVETTFVFPTLRRILTCSSDIRDPTLKRRNRETTKVVFTISAQQSKNHIQTFSLKKIVWLDIWASTGRQVGDGVDLRMKQGYCSLWMSKSVLGCLLSVSSNL